MNKQKFLIRLKKALRGCSATEIQSRLAFYSEMIDDRVEEGFSEKEAIQAIGDPVQIAEEIRMELGEKKKDRRPLSTGAKILIALGSPIWLSLLIAAVAVGLSLVISLAAVVFSVFVCMFAALICVFAAVFALGVSALACLIAGIACAFEGMFIQLLLWTGVSFVCAGLCIALALLCVPAGKGILRAIAAVWRLVSRTVFRRKVYA
ncbi:MAG: DUF1700 domain-containing protein [Clostridia bacterium]|nr:DUF1700 domain-containing protein [Clostridia bacterium]